MIYLRIIQQPLSQLSASSLSVLKMDEAEQNEDEQENKAELNEAEQKVAEKKNEVEQEKAPLRGSKPGKRGRWSCLDTILTTNPASPNESVREEEGSSACRKSTGRNNYGALPVEGNSVGEGPTGVGNRSLRFLVVLSAFFLRRHTLCIRYF